MMRRREFITLIGGAAAWPVAVGAQQQTKTAAPARVGLLTVSPPTPAMLNAFREGMREHGYVEGQNLSIDVRWPRGSTEEISTLAVDLANANLDVIVAWATPSVLALQHATSTVPIVMVSVGDPLGSGFVASLARPGTNITGLSNIAADLSGKLLELFSELVPNLKHVGIVSNSYNPNVAVQLRQTEEAARSLGLRSRIVDVSAAEDFERAFARLSAEGVDGVVVLADPLVLGHAQRIAELAQAARLPTAFQRRENVEAGGLMSYGSDLVAQFRQATFYVDRILRGTRPADLPVEQPTKYNLVINQKAAKVLGLKIPQTLLVAADEVIE
jgi:putative tryptophan/tyrosine transport system substrate-binding protein